MRVPPVRFGAARRADERFAPARLLVFAAAGLLAEAEDFAAPPAAVDRDFDAVVRFAAELRLAVAGLRALPALLLRAAPPVLRLELVFRAAPPVLRLEVPAPLEADEEDPPSIGHLPDITFCAASATASAISEPSLVALDITDFAALSAVSAASIPASLIAFRALGLAAIAAAAAVRPAASISLLIAPFAILFIVSFDFGFDFFEDDVRLLDLAIADLRWEFVL